MFRPVCFLWQRHDPVEAQGHRAGGIVRQGRDLTTSREHYGPIFQLRCLWFLSPWTKWTRVVKHGKGISEETTTSVLEFKMVAKSELSLPTINVDNVQTQRLSAATSISYRPATIPGVCLGISIFFFPIHCAACSVTSRTSPGTNLDHARLYFSLSSR